MTYSSGNTILDDDYNIFVRGGASAVDHNTANVNTIWGAGTGVIGANSRGWGQSGSLATVSAGSTITATQWVSLLNRISTIANHQGTTITAISNPSTGDTISAYTALSGNITSVFNAYDDCAASGTSAAATGSLTGTWYTTSTITRDINFGTAAKARYFFNAGGRIAVTFSRSGGTASSKNTGWTNLCSACGTITLTNGSRTQSIAGSSYTGTTKTGGSGTTNILATTTGFVDLTTSYVNTFRQYDATYLYTSNYITLKVKHDGSGVVSLQGVFQDDANTTAYVPGTGNASPVQDEPIDGTLSMTVTVIPPGTTYISDTWGTPTNTGSASQS